MTDTPNTNTLDQNLPTETTPFWVEGQMSSYGGLQLKVLGVIGSCSEASNLSSDYWKNYGSLSIPHFVVVCDPCVKRYSVGIWAVQRTILTAMNAQVVRDRDIAIFQIVVGVRPGFSAVYARILNQEGPFKP